MNYSVLMSVYDKEQPEFLEKSIESVVNQTVVTDDFVIVCDGPLKESLSDVLKKMHDKYPFITIFEREKNEGLGSALSFGLLQTKNEIIMRMDSDDICLPERASIQLPLMNDFDVVGGTISEFNGSEDNIIGYRCVPLSFEKIYSFAKKRNPFNHPSVMFKKSVILEAGNYQTLLYFEDYYLWVRVLSCTHKVCNVPNVLVNMRSGVSMRKRRGGKKYRKSLKTLRKYMLKNKFISFPRYLFLNFAQSVFSIASPGIKEKIYKKFLRKKELTKTNETISQ